MFEWTESEREPSTSLSEPAPRSRRVLPAAFESSYHSAAALPYHSSPAHRESYLPRYDKERIASREPPAQMLVPRWVPACLTIAVLTTVSIGAAVSVWDTEEHVRRLAHHEPQQPPPSRVVHLSVAGRSHLTRLVMRKENIVWDQFLRGVRERLQLPSVGRIETSLGEEITSTDDIVNNDHLIVN